MAFLRGKITRDSYSKTELAFVFGKARVAPMIPLTIPKLELQAVLSSGQLRHEIQLALTIPVEWTFMWTYITTVLQWLQTTDRLSVFVANRVAKILELTTTDKGNYVSTSENPAEAGTLGRSAHALSESHCLKSPDFLKTENWPLQPSVDALEPIKKNNCNSDQIPSKSEKQEATAIIANVANNATIFEWQKYSS